jgi:hypothetical protein
VKKLPVDTCVALSIVAQKGFHSLMLPMLSTKDFDVRNEKEKNC